MSGRYQANNNARPAARSSTSQSNGNATANEVRRVAYTVRDYEGAKGEPKSWWTAIGKWSVNKDGSTTVYLDALPTSGPSGCKIILREEEARDANG